ncbi:tonB-dependent siderophore receptor family protein, partial [Vibrio parahaemolyticus V-223/04]
TTR